MVIVVNLGRDLDFSPGETVMLKENKTGTLIAYDSRTGRASVEVEAIHEVGENKFNNSDQLNS